MERLGSGWITKLDVPNRNEPRSKAAKARLEAYADIGRALDVVRTFECDLFASSLVPIIIAHRHASISRVPGGKVLDIAGLAAFAAARPSAGA